MITTYRVIGCSSENGNEETVIFTEDFENPVKYFCRNGLSVNYDEKKELDLPDGFPLEHILERSY